MLVRKPMLRLELAQDKIPVAWTTIQELAFIKGLGTGKFARRGMWRKTLLFEYRRTAAIRHDWGKIDPGAVLAFVEEEIRRLEI